MNPVYKDDRILLRKGETYGRRVAGVVVIFIGLFFVAGEILFQLADAAVEYVVGGFGLVVALIGVANYLHAGRDDYVALDRPQMYVDGTDYDLSIEVACVVLTECVREIEGTSTGTSRIRYLQVFAILADDDRPVAETARRLEETGMNVESAPEGLPDGVPVEVAEPLDARSITVLHRLLEGGTAEVIYVGETSERSEFESVRLAETIARQAGCPLVDVHGESLECVEADELGLSLTWRLAEKADQLEDPGAPPPEIRHESTPEGEVVVWNPDEHTDRYLPSMGRRGGDHRLAFDGHRIRFRTTIPWGVDRELAVDDVMDIRRRRDPDSRSVIDTKPDTELVILTDRDQLVLNLPERGAEWLETKLRFWMANPGG